MKRVLLLLLVAGGAIYATYTVFPTAHVEPTDLKPGPSAESPVVETAQTAQEPDQIENINPPAKESRHAIVVEDDASPAGAPSPPSSTGSTQAPPSAELNQVEHVSVTSPATIREGPSTSTAIIGIAQPNAEAQVISRDSEWVQVIDPGSKKTGWIHSSFLAPTQPSSPSLSPEQVDAALDASDQSEASVPNNSKPSMRAKKPRKHGFNKHRRRGFALRFMLGRRW
jgi:hypothetical protein